MRELFSQCLISLFGKFNELNGLVWKPEKIHDLKVYKLPFHFEKPLVDAKAQQFLLLWIALDT